jgi:hypothetical protein
MLSDVCTRYHLFFKYAVPTYTEKQKNGGETILGKNKRIFHSSLLIFNFDGGED